MLKAEDLFNSLKKQAGICQNVRGYDVHPVKSGDTCIVESFFGLVEASIDEDGFSVSSGASHAFYNNADFKKEFVEARLNTSAAKELPEGSMLEPVSAGDSIITYPFGKDAIGVVSIADEDGFMLTLPDEAPEFISLSDLHIKYKTAYSKESNGLSGIFNKKSDLEATDNIYKYVVIPEDTVFDFAGGAYEAEAGSILYKNDADEDGYTSVPADYFAKHYKVSVPFVDEDTYNKKQAMRGEVRRYISRAKK